MKNATPDTYVLDIAQLRLPYFHYEMNSEVGEVADNSISIQIPKGKITALIGRNGTGKTTLFNVISGFERAISGKVTFWHKSTPHNIIGLREEQISGFGIKRMFQENHIFPNLSILDNMLIASNSTLLESPLSGIFRRTKIERDEELQVKNMKIIFEDLFGSNSKFWEEKDSLAAELSFGEKRLLGLARLFMGDRNLVLLDEPTSGIDDDNIIRIRNVIKEKMINNGMSVFLIEHNMEEVRATADYSILLENGKIIQTGDPGVVTLHYENNYLPRNN